MSDNMSDKPADADGRVRCSQCTDRRNQRSKTVKESGVGLIKSKERVRKHGEVFTPAWAVKDMCGMLAENNPHEDVFRIDSTFLEPSCGTGNFLVEIFERKLRNCGTVQDGLTALSSIYGIDIMADNVAESRNRLEAVFTERFGSSAAVVPVLERNIICGNFLTGRTDNGEMIWFLEDESDYWKQAEKYHHDQEKRKK